MSTISPNMNLLLPVVGGTPGPDYALDVNNDFSIIDLHDHSPGKGVPVTPAGININSAFPFNDNFAVSLAGLTLTPQLSTPAINTVYESGVDLYYIDGDGNNVRLTQSGGVAGSPGSISNLASPASAAYVSGSQTFVWESGANIAANMDFGSALLRNLSPNSTYALTLQPPTLSSNYTITLPTLPVASSFMTIDSSGTIAASPAVLGALTTSNLSASANIIGTQLSASANILGSQLSASANIAKTQMVSLGQQTASITNAFATTSTSLTDVTSLSVSITTTGRPVLIMLQSNTTNSLIGGATLNAVTVNPGASSAQANFAFVRGSTVLNIVAVGTSFTASGVGIGTSVPPSSMMFIDTPAAGTYTYKLQAQAGGANMQAGVNRCSLVVWEL